jgi:glycerate kinase
VLDVPGAGAAGGLGAALIAFLGAELRSGARVVGEAAGIEARVKDADLVITGEGRLDGQTAFGKTPYYVAKLAKAAGRPVICIAGSFAPGYETSLPFFTLAEALSDGAGPLPKPSRAAEQVARASERAVEVLIARGLLVVDPVD